MRPRRGIEGSKKRLSAGFLVRFEGGGLRGRKEGRRRPRRDQKLQTRSWKLRPPFRGPIWRGSSVRRLEERFHSERKDFQSSRDDWERRSGRRELIVGGKEGPRSRGREGRFFCLVQRLSLSFQNTPRTKPSQTF